MFSVCCLPTAHLKQRELLTGLTFLRRPVNLSKCWFVWKTARMGKSETHSWKHRRGFGALLPCVGFCVGSRTPGACCCWLANMGGILDRPRLEVHWNSSLHAACCTSCQFIFDAVTFRRPKPLSRKTLDRIKSWKAVSNFVHPLDSADDAWRSWPDV